MRVTCPKWRAASGSAARRSIASSRISASNMPSRANCRSSARGRKGSAPHPQRAHVKIEDGVLLLAVRRVEFPEAHDLAHDLGVEALALGFGIDFADIGGQRRLFLFE